MTRSGRSRSRATGASSRRRCAPICKFNVGDAYDPGKVDQSIKALFATGLFADVRIDRDGAGRARHRGREPGHQSGGLRGQQRGRQGDAAAPRCSSSRARCSRAPARRPTCSASSTSTAGRAGSPPSVDPKIIELDNNRVNVVFEINEGTATKVKAINFIGNRAFSDSQLRDIITTTQSSLFDFLKGTNIYDPDRLALDRELLRQYYLKNGYADARVVVGGRRARSRRLGLLHHLRHRRGRAVQVRHRRHRVGVCPASMPTMLRGELLTVGGRDLRPVADGQDGGEAHARRLRAGLRVRPRAPARRARCRRAHDQRDLHRSTKGRASTSSASTSSATRAPATTSSAASSAWPKATPTIR